MKPFACVEGKNTLVQGNLIINNMATRNVSDYPPPPANDYVGPVEGFGGPFTNSNPWINFKTVGF